MQLRRALFDDDANQRMDTVRLEKGIRAFREGASEKVDVDADQTARIEKLENDLAETKMYLVALIRLLVKKDLLRDDEFINALNVADVWDGGNDGGYDGPMGDSQNLSL